MFLWPTSVSTAYEQLIEKLKSSTSWDMDVRILPEYGAIRIAAGSCRGNLNSNPTFGHTHTVCCLHWRPLGHTHSKGRVGNKGILRMVPF